MHERLFGRLFSVCRCGIALWFFIVQSQLFIQQLFAPLAFFGLGRTPQSKAKRCIDLQFPGFSGVFVHPLAELLCEFQRKVVVQER